MHVEHTAGVVTLQVLLVRVLQGRACQDDVLAAITRSVDSLPERIQPGPPVRVRQRCPAVQLFDVRCRVVVVRFDQTPAELIRQELTDGGFAGAGDAHQHEDHAATPVVRKIKTDSTYPPAGLFTKDAKTIARVMATRKVSLGEIASGIRMVEYFISRGGKGLSATRKHALEKAKRFLQAKALAKKNRSAQSRWSQYSWWQPRSVSEHALRPTAPSSGPSDRPLSTHQKSPIPSW